MSEFVSTSITVGQLINKLSKFDENSLVLFTDSNYYCDDSCDDFDGTSSDNLLGTTCTIYQGYKNDGKVTPCQDNPMYDTMKYVVVSIDDFIVCDLY